MIDNFTQRVYRFVYEEVTMNVNLTSQLEDFIHSKVKSGLYNSASEVVRDALRLLEEQDRIKEL